MHTRRPVHVGLGCASTERRPRRNVQPAIRQECVYRHDLFRLDLFECYCSGNPSAEEWRNESTERKLYAVIIILAQRFNRSKLFIENGKPHRQHWSRYTTTTFIGGIIEETLTAAAVLGGWALLRRAASGRLSAICCSLGFSLDIILAFRIRLSLVLGEREVTARSRRQRAPAGISMYFRAL